MQFFEIVKRPKFSIIDEERDKLNLINKRMS